MIKELQTAIRVAKQAGDMALQGMDKISSVKFKEDARDVVTEYDLKAEKYIVRELSKTFPRHGFILEEQDDIKSKSGYTWVVDPIDGTKLFVCGVKLFTCAIALWKDQEPILGAVYHPGTGDCYYARRGGGAFVNKKRIHVSKIKALKEAIVQIDVASMNHLSASERGAAKKRIASFG